MLADLYRGECVLKVSKVSLCKEGGAAWKEMLWEAGSVLLGLGLGDQEHGLSVLAHLFLGGSRQGWGWVCRCWGRARLRVGKDDRQGTSAGDEDMGKRLKRAIRQQ